MTQPIHLIADVYAVEVPEGAKYHRIDGVPNGEHWELIFYKDGDDIDFPEEIEEIDNIDLPYPGNWQLICTTKEANERLAKGIVGSSEWFLPERHTRYIDYEQPIGPDNRQAWNAGFSNALLSLRSLIASKKLDLNKNYVLIKKLP